MSLPDLRPLDVSAETEFGKAIRNDLEHNVIGQADAITYFSELIEKFKSRLYNTTKPIGSVLFTGPTGVGKTLVTEMFAESLQPPNARDSKLNMLKVDCAEYQHSHEIAKLIGSPPGYLGHRETPPVLCTARITELQSKSEHYNFAILLFDEIEKASDALWHVLLGVLDKGEITTGSNERVDLTRTVVVMTSNAGSAEMGVALGDGVGFKTPEESPNVAEIKRIGIAAAKRKFSLEFINRLDGVVAFHALDRAQVAKVLKLELEKLQFEIFSKCTPRLMFFVSKAAQEALLTEGYDPKFNARNIKRTIDKQLRLPLARIIGNKSIQEDEDVAVDYIDGQYTFGAAHILARKVGL